MRRILPSRSVKRPASSKAGGPRSEAKKRSREKVEVFEDAWLVAFKHLTCPQWSKMRLVCRQLSGVVQRNASRLPMVVIDSVEMRSEQRNKAENKIIASDIPILPKQKLKWFKDRGIALYLPADIEVNNAIIGIDFKGKRSVDLVIQGDRTQFKARVLFRAEFSPHRNKYSWASMAFSLKLIYDQSTFVENLSMYALDKKLKAVMLPGEEERYIHCGTFTLQVSPDPSSKDLRESLTWLEQNVQAEKIEIPTFLDYDEEEICDAMSNFLLGSSWISASQEVNIGHVNELNYFFRALIKKFRSLDAVQSTFPIILFFGIQFFGTTFDVPLKRFFSGKEELEDFEDNNSGDDTYFKTYTISNGANQMRVKFMINQEYVAPPRRASKAARGPSPSGFDIRVTVRAGEPNAV
ncbi:hypothetical protein DdX_21234 [Ditylenchus destructor]|uniref:Uncharacterized protein n=1 Tax=Ditylenchus destructor TaxID=166010 RepID=A0AAD4MG33_9BILA|nr:hypothetical protein DdX_21234 [Ditylenchus destructor]